MKKWYSIAGWALALAIALNLPATAHEFWIEPETYIVSPGDEVRASLRVGEEFKGSGYSYNPRNFRSFDFVLNGTRAPVPGRAGDRPALQMPVAEEGLLVIAHATTDSSLTYTVAEKFENFLRHKDWIGLLDVHIARGLPETGFKERYSRYVKSLVQVGEGAGQDAEVGFVTEIVALANPYMDGLDALPVRVLYQGKPRVQAQVEVFEKAPDDSVRVALYKTDASGEVSVPVKPGYRYLFDAVVIRPVEPVDEKDPVWESLWAALTFAVPAD